MIVEWEEMLQRIHMSPRPRPKFLESTWVHENSELEFAPENMGHKHQIQYSYPGCAPIIIADSQEEQV